MARPAPPYDAAPGRHWKAVADPGWRLAFEGAHCSHPGCIRLATVAFARSYPLRGREVTRWWDRCRDHAYGRWREQGAVLCWQAMPDA